MQGSDNRKRGFTLIELLVVISIISMLSSLVLGAVTNARKKAFYAKAALDMRTVETALELYYQDHGDWPNVSARTGPDPDNGNIVTWPNLEAALRPYLPKLPTPAYASVLGVSEYLYLHGSEASPDTTQKIFDRGAFQGCIKVGKGYFLDFFWDDVQTPLTLNDGGFDPDGIDRRQGNVKLLPPQPNNLLPDYCPTPS